ncbi:MAG: calcium/sodium antiporter [Bacteroidia bacterium]
MLIYILFVIGLALLIKGADWLVDGASALAKQFNISDLIIGLTIVSFGTSAPELFVNVYASYIGNTDITIGNILGSNIANIFLILGVSSIIFPLAVQKNTTWKEIPFSLLAAVLVGIMATDVYLDKTNSNAITRTDGLSLLAFFIIFMYYIFETSKKEQQDKKNDEEINEQEHMPLLKSIGLILIGLTGLSMGGKWIVDGAVSIATSLGVSQSLIGLTIVAIGTSLPELATSAIAAFKKNADIAVGNVVGSNIFNVFWILGLSSIMSNIPFQEKNFVDIGMTIFASLLLFLFMFIGKKHILQRWQGILFLLFYTAYIIYLVMMEGAQNAQ